MKWMLIAVSLSLAACAAPQSGPLFPEGPPSSAQFLAQAQSYERQGDTVRAEQYYLSAWESGAATSEVLPRLLHVCVQGARLENALLHMSRARRELPADPALHLLHVELLRSLDRKLEALHEASILAQEAAAPGEIFFTLALLELDVAGDEEAARSSLETYLERAPEGRHRAWAMAYLGRDGS